MSDILNAVIESAANEQNKKVVNKTAQKDSNSEDPFYEEGGLLASPVITDIRSKLDLSSRSRQRQEAQWIRNVNAYRGHDNEGKSFRDSEKNKVYVRTTTVKVKAAYAQIVEALFSDGTFPVSVKETKVPEGVSEWTHLKTEMEASTAPEKPASPLDSLAGGVGFEGDGLEIAPGSTADNLSFLGGLEEEFTNNEGDVIMDEGYDPSSTGINVSPAKEIARRMEKIIHDQIEESNGRTETRRAIFEMCLLGTGVMKGPFIVNKTIPKWEPDDNGVMRYKPLVRKSFQISYTSLWNTYTDPNALCSNDLEWLIERHRMNRQQLAELKSRPHFYTKALDRLLSGSGNYTRRSFEHTLDESNSSESEESLYEVLEYWGYMDRETIEEFDLPADSFEGDRAQVNVWVSGDEVLRVVVNPFLPQRIPYYIIPYENDPWSIYGSGVPESMEDSQAMMNGFARLAVDNLALSGNLVFDVDTSMLVPGQDMTIEPGKIYERQSGGAGQAIHGISFPNTAPANMEMFRQWRQMADEETGIPSFAHGQTGVTSPTRTASGMSMLLQNASLNIKTVIRNLDDFYFAPLGQAYYRCNMQYNDKVDIKGDLEVLATGSSSLQAKEVRANRISTFLQLSSNPAIAPLIKLPSIVKELAIALDMDSKEILNSPEEQEIYARVIGMQNAMAGPAAGAPGVPAMGGMPGGVAMPDDSGFTGSPQAMGGMPPSAGGPM